MIKENLYVSPDCPGPINNTIMMRWGTGGQHSQQLLFRKHYIFEQMNISYFKLNFYLHFSTGFAFLYVIWINNGTLQTTVWYDIAVNYHCWPPCPSLWQPLTAGGASRALLMANKKARSASQVTLSIILDCWTTSWIRRRTRWHSTACLWIVSCAEIVFPFAWFSSRKLLGCQLWRGGVQVRCTGRVECDNSE